MGRDAVIRRRSKDGRCLVPDGVNEALLSPLVPVVQHHAVAGRVGARRDGRVPRRGQRDRVVVHRMTEHGTFPQEPSQSPGELGAETRQIVRPHLVDDYHHRERRSLADHRGRRTARHGEHEEQRKNGLALHLECRSFRPGRNVAATPLAVVPAG